MRPGRAFKFRERIARWWMVGRIPRAIVPLRLRGKWYERERRRRLESERDELFREMWTAADAEPDEAKREQILDEFQKRIDAGPSESLVSLDARQLQDRASSFGIDYDIVALNTPKPAFGSLEWAERHREMHRLCLAINDAWWRRAHQISETLVPILALIVALLALLDD